MSELNKNLSRLATFNQSFWYDNLSRNVLNSGELQEIINSGVTGLTSNPSTFKKAIADSADYDSDIVRLSKTNDDLEAVVEELMVQDVRKAAQLLQPVYRRSNGADGFASIELSPVFSSDAEKSIEQGKRLWNDIKLPNVMIKVPATEAGLEVIEALISQGINVNVTLIFSASVYERVVESYMAGIEKRVAQNEDISTVQSVASFFLSRVDASIEKNTQKYKQFLTADDIKALSGTVAIANAKLAYRTFKQLFSSKRWKALEEKGAHVQRPLWASTGTKNPDQDPLMYIKAVIGESTVNTVPPETLKKIVDTDFDYLASLAEDAEGSEKLISKVRSLGIPWEKLLAELQKEGVKSFGTAYSDLLAAVKKKKDQVS